MEHFFRLKRLISNKNFKNTRRHDVSYYESLNHGIKLSNGEYVGILNSGDTFVNRYVLEKLTEVLVKIQKYFYSNLIFKKRKM